MTSLGMCQARISSAPPTASANTAPTAAMSGRSSRGLTRTAQSTSATAALALVLCAVLVSPRELRPLIAAVGAVFALAVGGALLILAWHMPSDVIGGYLTATLWAALALAALRAGGRP